MKSTLNRNGGKKSLSLEKLVNHLIAKGMKALETGKLKVTIADLIRVRERHKELIPNEPSGTEVTWIDGPGKRDSPAAAAL
jgi:hypothetical protein